MNKNSLTSKLTLSSSLAGLVCAVAASVGHAAPVATPEGFSAEARGTQRAVYDSNALRNPFIEQEIFCSTTSPELMLRWKTPTSLVESNSRVNANFYDESAYNSVDMHQKLLLSRNNQRWLASLRAKFDRDTTRTSELTNYNLNIAKVYSTRLGIAPQIAFRPSTRNGWLLNATVNNVTYNNDAFTDYNIFSISPSYERRLDQQNTVVVTLNTQRYETASGADSRSDSYGPSLGWNSLLSPRLTLRANAGALATKKSGANAGTDPRSWNYVFSGTLAYKGDQDSLDLTATRAREPFGNGTETLLDTFSATHEHRLSEALTLNARAKYQTADYSSQPGTNLDDGITTGAGVAYSITDHVDLNADYNYRNEGLTGISTRIDQHIVMLGISYQPSWSGK